ncbi:MAG: BatA domain-containing protein [Ignavibacteriaceae bacterium]|nr:BatA domain-containing protein [Ignavibacteriaceae bacterium]
MTFLNPAVLFGLIAASVPILIHLFNLRKLKKIEFSTLAFLKELQKNKIRKIKLKQWILLALRVLIILFLVFAFARPTLKGIAIGGTTSAAKTTAVLIIDDTFSMSVIDNNGSLLNQAKAAAKNLLKNFQEGDEVAVIQVSQSDKKNVNLSKSIVDIQKSIDAIEPSYQSSLLHNSITKAVQVLSQSKNFNKEIYILSDFQSGRLADEKTLSDFSSILYENVRIYAVNYSGKDVYNIGVDNLKVNTQIFEKDKPVNFTITVTNYSNQNVDNVIVSLFVDNERSAQVSANINAGESKQLTIDALVKSSGFVNVFAEIEDDEILHDNRRYTSVFIPAKIPIIIFTDDAADSRFIELALTAIENQNTFGITEKNLSELSAYDLKRYEVVLIIGSQNLNAWNKLREYSLNNGSLFLAPGSRTTLAAFQKMLDEIGLSTPTTLVGKAGDQTNSVLFETTDINHPVFQNIFTNKEKTKIESPDIFSYFKISTQGKGRNIITLQDGSSFLAEYRIKDGKIFLMNSAPVLSWSNFPLKSIFVPLMNKSVLYLASKDKSEMNILAGDDFDIDLRGRSVSQLKVLRPDNTDEFIPLDESAANTVVKYDKSNLIGNYKILSSSKVFDQISVNADPMESKTQYLEKQDVENYLSKINFQGKLLFLDREENIGDAVLKARFGSELWKHFLIIALLFAFVEMLVARSAKKDLVEMSK